MNILGISAFYHDSAACLVQDGRVVAAAQEERFTRRRHDDAFPARSIEWCLRRANVMPEALDYVAFYDKPLLKFERVLETFFAAAPAGLRSFLKTIPPWLTHQLRVRRELTRGLRQAFRKAYVFTERHEALAAGAFYPSPFEEAAVLSIDTVGEWATTSFGDGCGHKLKLTHKVDFPHSLGLLHGAVGRYLGCGANGAEPSWTDLAPLGQPKYVALLREKVIDAKDDGSFRLDLSYFDYADGRLTTREKFHRLLGRGPRSPAAAPAELDRDLAASLQRLTEDVVLRMAHHVHRQTGQRRLCLGGDVALNGALIARLAREGPFEALWTQPAAGDAGGALGAALFIWHKLLEKPRVPGRPDGQSGSLLGPAFGDEEIRGLLDSVGAAYTAVPDDEALCSAAAEELANGKVLGWFEGPLEFGASGAAARSILCDPRQAPLRARMNLKVKYRDGLLPCGAAVLRERYSDYFETAPQRELPALPFVAPLKNGQASNNGDAGRLPTVMRDDESACTLTVDRERHGLFHRVIEKFAERTGCPVLAFTGLNLHWDPLACTPTDAYRTFMASDMDVLCLGRFVLHKQKQRSWVPAEAARTLDADLGDVWASPCCQATLAVRGESVVCTKCNRAFPIEDGIPVMFFPHEQVREGANVTDMVKSFYEDAPFPNYNDHDSVASLVEKSRRGVYARNLDEAIPYNSRVIEVGCGTGQLSNFLGISCRSVIGADLCLNSLRLADGFRKKHGLWRVRFVEMNLFRPCFRPEQFDVVLCNGVLLTTHDPYAGFRSILRLVRPGGHIVIGLYNTYGRLATDARRMIFRLTGGRGLWLDPYLRSMKLSKDKQRAWFRDQYKHPHETKQTFGEVLGWFDQCGLEFVHGVPPLTIAGYGADTGRLFKPVSRGNAFDRFWVQTEQIIKGSYEGGFFIMIARKPETVVAPGRAAEQVAAAR